MSGGGARDSPMLVRRPGKQSHNSEKIPYFGPTLTVNQEPKNSMSGKKGFSASFVVTLVCL